MSADSIPPSPFDWQNPDYAAEYRRRTERLAWVRANPGMLPSLKSHYALDPAAFICDWGLTSDPRAKNRGAPIEMPFILFERQKEMLSFILERMKSGEPGLIEKARDCGASFLVACLCATLCLFNQSVVIGIGSRKEDALDRSGDPATVLWKVRFFLKNLPPEFRGGWDESRHSAHLRIQFPESGSAITCEAGDSIGRGGRTTVYFVDESAFLERPQLIEQSLASNTDCRIDISTPNGRANAFAVKRWSGKVKVFTFGWRDDPRKDDAWYQRQCELLDAVTRAQEIDLSYDASVSGILIPSEWVQASIGAHLKLGIDPTGERRGALDIADEGRDRCAFVGRRGILLEHLQSWSGKNSDIFQTVVKTFGICDQRGYSAFDFDGDGLGAGARGDAAQINLKRSEAGKPEIQAEPFRGSASVADPEGSLIEGRLNKDFFSNLKAQAWWALRLRFQATFRAVVESMPFDPDSIISIDPALPELTSLVQELVQPTYSVNQVGKIVVDKTPEGAASPNLADAVMIAYSPFKAGAYFAAPTMSDPAGAAPQLCAIPSGMDHVYAVVSFVEDVAAVVFCAANRPDDDGTRGPGFVILDWDLRVLDANLDAWMWAIAETLDLLYEAVDGKLSRTICFDNFSDEGYAVLMQQRGFPAVAIGDDLPPIIERFNKARPYVAVGLISWAQAAHDKTVTFRGTKRNFLREVMSQPTITESNPLAVAFASAVLMAFRGRQAVPPPRPIPAEEQWSPHDLRDKTPWAGFRMA